MTTFARNLTSAALPLALLVATASPAAAARPEPVAGTPACGGLLAAFFNDQYGPNGASGNEQASAGPGYFLRTHTAEVVHGDRDTHC